MNCLHHISLYRNDSQLWNCQRTAHHAWYSLTRWQYIYLLCTPEYTSLMWINKLWLWIRNESIIKLNINALYLFFDVFSFAESTQLNMVVEFTFRQAVFIRCKPFETTGREIKKFSALSVFKCKFWITKNTFPNEMNTQIKNLIEHFFATMLTVAWTPNNRFRFIIYF